MPAARGRRPAQGNALVLAALRGKSHRHPIRSLPGYQGRGFEDREGLNSKIQSIKSAARGFHSFASYRIRILFFCGKLDPKPRLTHSI